MVHRILKEDFKHDFPQITDCFYWSEGIYKGRTFDTLCSDGIKPQGKPAIIFISQEIAENAYGETLTEYLQERIDKNKTYTLIWRKLPEFVFCPIQFPLQISPISYIYKNEEILGGFISSRLLLIENDNKEND